MMHRHFYLLVPAPGRADEAASALDSWLDRVDGLPGFHRGAVLREYAHECKGFPDVLALTYDLDSETRHAFWETTKSMPDPMRPDLPGEIPADQSAILVSSPERAHSSDDEHDHTHDDHGHASVDQLDFNRGGGLFARVLHVHSEILTDTTRYAGSAMAVRTQTS